MRTLLSLASVVAVVLSVGCATPSSSSSGGRSTPRTGRGGGESEPTDVLIPPERVDELTQYFNGKNNVVSRCFDEVEGAKPKAVRLTVELLVTADGTAKDVKVTSTSGAPEALKTCVEGLVAGWALPAPGHDMPFSHGYAFEAE